MFPTLSLIDWSVIIVYLLGVGLVGYLVSGRQASTRDYFLGGRSLPWWAAALSIIATETSAVTFIGIPAKAFTGDWSVLQLVLGFVLGRIFLALVFVAVFYRSDYLTVYGFLEHRFGPKTRSASALFFILGRLVASGVRLYAACRAVHFATGISISTVIIALGIFGILFTLVGGIRAVVWTDVILGLTFAAGAAVSIAFMVFSISGGLPAILSEPWLAEKLNVIRFSFDPADSSSLIAGILGGFVLTLATHGTDQDIAQRMLTCRDSRSGRLSVMGSAALILPVFILFLAVGTALFAYIRLAAGDLAWPERAEDKYLVFIVRDLPVGLSGFVMAGLLAAALSSFTSALNALASTSIGDFYRPLRLARRELPESHFLRASRAAMLLCGGALILSALAFIDSEENIFNLAIKVFGYFYGALLGPFLVGILTRRGTDGSTLAGMLCSLPVALLLQMREYAAAPHLAPAILRRLMEEMPRAARDAIELVPEIAYPYWIIITTLVCGAVALVRSGRSARR
ncbi:MAG: sodium/solute symporter [Planctomycetes bacterium]|nr:sodium/solute symporter [Planctomycetota bacterium]